MESYKPSLPLDRTNFYMEE